MHNNDGPWNLDSFVCMLLPASHLFFLGSDISLHILFPFLILFAWCLCLVLKLLNLLPKILHGSHEDRWFVIIA